MCLIGVYVTWGEKVNPSWFNGCKLINSYYKFSPSKYSRWGTEIADQLAPLFIPAYNSLNTSVNLPFKKRTLRSLEILSFHGVRGSLSLWCVARSLDERLGLAPREYTIFNNASTH